PRRPSSRPSSRARPTRSAWLESLLESLDGTGEIADRESYPDGRQAVLAQRLQVAVGLRVDELADRVGLPAHIEVVLPVVHELEELPGRRAALVELAGGVEEARAVAPRGR